MPRLAPKTDWQFETDADFEGWTPNGYLNAAVGGGALAGKTTGPDPILQGPGVRIEADCTRRLVVRMRSDRDDWAQLFWATATSSQSEANSIGFPVVGDGQFHNYELDLSKSPQWRGLITSLRFDPSAKAETSFAVDYIQCFPETHE